ncbi:MAG: hypothetical protein QXP80_04815 [Zestosphaera sp.]
MRGQSDLISAVVLVSAVLVMSVGFLGYVSALLSQRTAESDLNNLLQREAANTLIYREYEEGEVIYLGVIRIDGIKSVYHYLAVNKTYCSINGAISIGHYIPGIERPSSDIYILTSDGQYVPLSTFTPFRTLMTSVPLNILPHGGSNELLEIDFSEATGSEPSNPNCLVVILFTQVGNNYYEVGRYYEVWG